MIYFNNNNQAELNFGHGDILVGGVVWYDDNVGGITFKQSNKCYEIRTQIPHNQTETCDPDILMTFENIESIDVVINKLQKVKMGMLRNMCGLPPFKA